MVSRLASGITSSRAAPPAGAAALSSHPKRRRLVPPADVPPPSDALPPASDRQVFARDRDGYFAYLRLIAKCSTGVQRVGNGRWLFDTTDRGLLHERVVAKDCYETPAWVYEHYNAQETLTVHASASALNTVAPTYITAADSPATVEPCCATAPRERE